MKALKKLVPAMCLLLISAVLLGTSTYAWFSMNTQVEATGMNVTAKSNASNLLIGNKAEIATDKTGLGATVAASYTTTGNDAKKCYPVAYVTEETVPVTGTTIPANSWYTATNKNSNAAADEIVSATKVDEGAKDYMLTYKVWLTLTADSEDTTKKIQVTFALGDTDDAATSAVVKIATGETTFDTLVLNSTTATTGTTATAVTLTSTSAVAVTVYVYIDGNSTNVNSDYINSNPDKLVGTVGLTFDLVAAD